MKLSSRYERFEPVTVRAALRVMDQASRLGMTPWEVADSLRELAAMDRFAGPGAYAALRRMAKRRTGGARGRRAAAPQPRLWFAAPVCAESERRRAA
jgi:hypothetical protein